MTLLDTWSEVSNQGRGNDAEGRRRAYILDILGA